ncbi:type I-E CRISPR-associated protein Cse1/CasA [Streptomyces sp. ISL-44]|uniref:type I-E CRISPR-associated protein Cse1/CasA n=1 Tax=Streptomyces sp. ISL-44 TaxID=2819184 RepID=UPI001BE63912|nr:type I-E CRISPR-associated protein Cse1/CasA [Streptomyces sp. ISL-44]MBT2544986.1 type I-E CRISPR-associated protein Cse1/CasA [Streptomyces sp. ISL-44]
MKDSRPHWSASLTPAARVVWAKHDRRTEKWLPLWRHMADSAAMAGRLWDEWVPRQVRELVAGSLPGGDADGRLLTVWLAALHDIGKATPAFACQVEVLADRMSRCGLAMPTLKQFGTSRSRAPHGLAGQVLLEEWLEHQGWPPRNVMSFAVPVGGHHGLPPAHEDFRHLRQHSELLRTPGPSEDLWRSVQTELLDACTVAYGVRDRFPEWRTVKLSQPVQALLSALVIVSDWIASNPDLFLLFPEDRPRDEAGRIDAAWRGIDLPRPWSPQTPEGTAQELFAARFDLPAIRPLQEEAVRLARGADAPGLMIIEAPMGEGKTEAALAVAEVFAARTGAGGCFIALPTRATSNAMYGRTRRWLKRLPGGVDLTVFLAHSKGALNDDFARDMRAGARTVAAVDLDGVAGVAPSRRDDTCSVSSQLVAHQWLRGRQKGLLAPFAVGTIDQLLFAGLKSRHLALRHLALAGKVVVIDEVHAYDAYMNAYLDRVLSWLGAYKVPVVMLSATLPAGRRRRLAEAYAGDGDPRPELAEADAYPLISVVAPGQDAVVGRPEATADRRTEVVVEQLSDDLGALADRLERELAEGGCALVVRNTVDRVLRAAEVLRERFGPEAVTVAHSRFLDLDRARKDDDLVARFGPSGPRPAGPHIVVASQVAEQSLDIDFDLLVTDLAPVDLVLQRMGRLHRHRRGPGQSQRPARLRTPRCLVTGVDWEAMPPAAVSGSVSVYGRHTLLRSLAVLVPHWKTLPVVLPDDISPLVQAAYADTLVAPGDDWADVMTAASAEHESAVAEQQRAADVFRLAEVRKPGRSLVGWIDAGVGDADGTRAGRAQVRDSDESLEVLVIQRRADGTYVTLPWLDRGRGGLEVPVDAVPPSRTARAVAASALRLPYHFSKPWVIDRAIEELERFGPREWQKPECHWLAGELILVLDEECQTRLAGFELRYSVADGLEVNPAGAKDVKLVKGVPSFDLVSRPWLPVQLRDGTATELSLKDVFARAGDVRRLVGDVPSQEFALLRLLLAILHDAVEGPEDLDVWEELYESPEPFADVAAYLDRHRERFDLLHPTQPFFQVSDLRTQKDEVASLNRIVADVPNGDQFFTMRRPGVDRLSFAEAARWLVHTQAFDTSGIKSGVVGDPRVKGGKGYPQGVGWAGSLGGVFVEGDCLQQTLLLNLIASDASALTADGDKPAWRREQCGPEVQQGLESRPTGPRDLYTWQSRRVRLHHDGQGVHGVVLSYGDPLAPHNKHVYEPMSGWRRSKPQEKKLGRSPVYMPREHDPSRAAWRSLASLLMSQGQEGPARRDEPAPYLRAGVLKWIAELTYERLLPQDMLIRPRLIGATYGTQQSVIDEVVDDGVTMAVILLHEHDQRYATEALDAVEASNAGVGALGDLAADLARAAGRDPEGPRDTTRDLGFGLLDGPYRQWLARLGGTPDPGEARADWQRAAHRILRETARQQLATAGGTGWLDNASAERIFLNRLNKAFPLRHKPGAGSPSDPERADISKGVAP